MKKIITILLLIGIIMAAVFARFIFGSGTAFPDNKKYLFVYTGKANEQAVMGFVKDNNLVNNPELFNWVAARLDVWKRLKPGRYEIKKGESIFQICRTLRNNAQSPVNLVINKLRTNENLAALLTKNFETKREWPFLQNQC